MSAITRLFKKTTDGRFEETLSLDLKRCDDQRALSLCGEAAFSCDEEGLCFKKYRADVVLAGFSSERYPVGATISLGTAEAVITMYKPCYPEVCERADKTSCPLRTCAAFARITRSGVVSTGDETAYRKS